MSFVREIVNIAKENDAVEAKKNINKINLEIKNYQQKVKKFIDAEYVDFLPITVTNEYYFDEGTRLCDEVTGLLDSVNSETKQDLYNATEELARHIEDLQELSLGLRSSMKILKIDELFQNIKQMNENSDNYMRMINLLDELKSLVNDPQDKILRRLDCYENIKIRYRMETEHLLHNIKQKFETLVQLNEKSFQSTKVVTVKITKDDNQLHDVLVALFKTKYNPKRVFDFLMNNVFGPVIVQPVSIDFNNNDPKFAHLELSYSLKPLDENLRPNYKTVFQNIRTVFECLGYMNVKLDANGQSCIFGLFAAHIKDNFFQLLTNDCLHFSIPGTIDEMNESTLIADIQVFNVFLHDMLFLGDEDHQLTEYAEKIECLFRNRFCTSILDTAVDIMRKDLHDMTLMAANDFQIKQEDGAATMPAGSGDSILFNRCMISKSTVELVGLLEKIIQQAKVGGRDDEITDYLFTTVSNILERYIIEVPQYHSKLLTNIPQQTALFHNNCMYLGYWIVKNSTDQQIESFATTANSIRSEGTKLFTQQMNHQKRQLMEILYDLDFAEHVNELGTGPQKIVRQCLRQLDLLKNVWQIILPTVVYNKSMGTLLNEFCGEIIKRICSLEDISSDVASGLGDIIGTIIDKAPSIFEDPLQASIHVKSWTKLAQLRMILCASLIQITEQWSEGKGPLTLNYKAEDIKNLIRALFQNTDRRANALASII